MVDKKGRLERLKIKGNEREKERESDRDTHRIVLLTRRGD